MTVTAFSFPQEIGNRTDADEYLRRCEKMLNSLPKSAPKKMRKAWEEKVSVARDLASRQWEA